MNLNPVTFCSKCGNESDQLTTTYNHGLCNDCVTEAKPQQGKTTEQQEFKVYLNGKLIDTVFWVINVDAEDVKESLVNHDGFDPSIEVKSA